MKKIETRDFTIGAMLTVLSVILLYSSTLFVTARLSILAICSVIIAIAVIEAGVSASLIVYPATAVLGAILVPNKMIPVSYICFFGYYPIAKYIIERKKSFVLEWVLKFGVFNISALASYGVMRLAFGVDFEFPFSIWIVVIAIQVLFMVYDYALSVAIGHYLNKFSRKTKMK